MLPSQFHVGIQWFGSIRSSWWRGRIPVELGAGEGTWSCSWVCSTPLSTRQILPVFLVFGIPNSFLGSCLRVALKDNPKSQRKVEGALQVSHPP